MTKKISGYQHEVRLLKEKVEELEEIIKGARMVIKENQDDFSPHTAGYQELINVLNRYDNLK